MEEIKIYAGLKLDANDGKSWRIINVSQIDCVLVEMRVKYKHIVTKPINFIIDEISFGNMAVSLDQEIYQMDENSLSQSDKTSFNKKRDFIREVEREYGPDYLAFASNTAKPAYKALLQKYGYSTPVGNKYLLRWIQSGKQESILHDARKHHSAPNSSYKDDFKRTGRKDSISSIVVTSKVKEEFDYGISIYKNTRAMTQEDAFMHVLWNFYSTGHAEDRKLLPAEDRPTLRQFRYYFSKKISKTEDEKIKTSREEFYNNSRVLFGFNRSSAVKPGYIVEVDALEVDINVVSSFNRQQNISRPIVYAMIDLFSHAIVAFHIGFDNNSMMGLSSLMLNLFDDKEILLKNLGLDWDPYYWPSRFIPNEVRCDRGSDFASNQYEIICNDLGILRTLEPGATGSMKGLIERSFGEFHQSIKPHLEKYGIMQKRYDSNHKKEACLTIKDMYLIFIMFVIEHNRHYFKDWKLTNDMISDGVDKTPISIWKWGETHKGTMTQITAANYENCLYKLLPEDTAFFTREGIKFRNLIYRVEKGSQLSEQCCLSKVNGNKRDKEGKRLNSITIRYDPRSIDNIYVLEKGRMQSLPIHSAKNGNLQGLTWDEYSDYRKKEKEMDKKGIEANTYDKISRINLLNIISEEAFMPTYASTKFTSGFRKLEKNAVNYSNRIENRLEQKNYSIAESTESEAPTIATESKEKEVEKRPPHDTDTIAEPINAPECPDDLCDFL